MGGNMGNARKVKLGRARLILRDHAAWAGVSVPRSVMRRETAALLPLARPRGLVAVLRLAWRCAVAAWRCSRAAARRLPVS
jgi:hypothetical protein